MTSTSIETARAALADSSKTVERLHKMCCEPDRSPRLRAIQDSLAGIESRLTDNADRPALDGVLGQLADLGAAIGRLQVDCCAPKRMPLYARALSGLTAVQLNINDALDRGHSLGS